MAKSKTQQAIDLIRENPGMTAYAAAAQVGVSEQAIYGAMRRTRDKKQCPCCGQVVRTGFDLDRGIIRDDAQPWDESLPSTYGGVVFDPDGKLLLREPKNHFDGYVWTFAKGLPAPGETADQTAISKVRSKTGADAEIIDRLPGEFVGGASVSRFFIMQAPAGSGGIKSGDKETASIRWVTVDEAAKLIQQTTNEVGRKRDLDVLGRAWAWWLLNLQEIKA